MKAPDKRCCGSGVCIINKAGECWCGQIWDGEKMIAPSLKPISSLKNTQGVDAEHLITPSDEFPSSS